MAYKHKLWRPLQAGDIVDIVAPSSAPPYKEMKGVIKAAEKTLRSWGLIPRIPTNLFGDDILCAHTDAQRFKFLKDALYNNKSSAVWCLRGGYGSTRLIPNLAALPTPKQCKIFIGMSDITALHILLQQKWHWPTLHGPSTNQVSMKRVHTENIRDLKAILFGKETSLDYLNLLPLNSAAKKRQDIQAPLIGGNLCLIQASLGTPWEMNANNKILFIEEINERGYQVDRILQHITQVGVLRGVKAILFGDFIQGNEPNGKSLIGPVLLRFAKECNFPVLRCSGIGHGHYNRPLPLGTPALLQLKKQSSLTVTTGCIR